jgi:hypothetical protein
MTMPHGPGRLGPMRRGPRATIAITALLAGLAVPPAARAAEPVDIIFDTDIGNDVDDVLALGLLHALESRGECRLLAVTITKDSPLAAPFTDAVNEFYGRGSMPIGVVRGGVTPEAGTFLPLARVRDGDRLRYPHDLVDAAAAPEAVRLLRQTLAGRPDRSVVIAQVGFSTNLARLLDSPADDVSPLNGRDLVAAKVRLLSLMAGAFAPINGNARFGEYNIVTDLPAARKVAAEWPTQMLWSGYEIGVALPYPAASIEQDYRYTAHHPLAEAYVLYNPPPHNRPTWDLTSVLAVVRPDRGYFGLSQPGRVTMSADGRTTFEPVADGRDRHLTATPEQAARAVEAFVNLCSEPARRH